MPSTSRSRRLIATAAAGLAVFLAVLVLLGAQMARGHDPALGASVSTKKATVTTAATTTADDSSSDDSSSTASQSTRSTATPSATQTPVTTSSS
jgi:hypothetical protein